MLLAYQSLVNNSDKMSTKYKRNVYKADFDFLMEKQHGYCANPKCEKFHGKKQRVSTTRDIDHKIAIVIWELKEFKGDPNVRRNLQLLCTDCHRRKTAEDKKWISILKKRKKEEEKKKKTTKKKPAKKKPATKTKKKTKKKPAKKKPATKTKKKPAKKKPAKKKSATKTKKKPAKKKKSAAMKSTSFYDFTKKMKKPPKF